MSLDLAALRTELTDALTAAGLTAYGHMPEQIHAPLIVLEPGDPYITDEPDHIPNGHVQVAFSLHIIAKPGTAAKQTTGLDELIADVLAAIPDQWGGIDLARPYRLATDRTQWPATRLDLTTITPL